MEDGAPWLLDVSEHQGNSLMFSALRGEGFSGVITKMTEGVGYVDPTGVSNLDRIIKNGLIPGAYHFLWGGMSARKQAESFLSQIEKVADPYEVMLFLDVEISGNMNPVHYPTFQNVEVFLHTLQAELPGKKLGIYSGYYWREATWMGDPPVDDLGLERTPIIWDAHYFTRKVGRASSLYEHVPASYWESPAFGGKIAHILQFADTVKTDQYVGDGNACRVDYERLLKWSTREVV